MTTPAAPARLPSARAAIDAALVDPGWERYAEYVGGQRPRIEYLLDLVDGLIAGRPAARVLDAGPSIQTAALRRRYPDVAVDSLGYALDAVPLRAGDRHVEFDLNTLYSRETWPALEPYDVVVFAEILEHLCTAPQTLFRALAHWTAPGGHLIVQTPNALDLPSRVRVALGRAPAGSIATLPEAGINIGHFREYTVDEVRRLGVGAGLAVERVDVLEYFARPGLKGRAWSAVARRLPASLRTGTTVVFGRPA
jgi:hypothetical protein